MNNLLINKYFLHIIIVNCLIHDTAPINDSVKKHLKNTNNIIEFNTKYMVHIIVILRIYELNSVCNKKLAFNVFASSGSTNVSILIDLIQKSVPTPTIISDVM